ncbi:Transmembrane protein [Holotrichia oblita]|uniref:Transmembrane protein n=1 Tax=Holotrichia oblita TaxID=644536 RepID=A0ACB9SY10_HOLOL|nr:Transmembrane protein [Holotrichia oblita]
MALLGAQLVITLLMISVIQKLGPYFSFAKWILCSQGLVRYLYPTDAELKQIANIPKDKQKAKRNKLQQNGKIETFHVPRNIDIKLKFTKVSVLDVIHLRVIVIVLAIKLFDISSLTKNSKTLFSLTVQYFKSDESEGERSTCLVMGLSYFLMAMMILIVDENTLELGLETAYNSFNTSASNFLTKQGLSTS